MSTEPKVVTRTCPQCGHRHSLGASTSEAAEFISSLEARADELEKALELQKRISDAFSAGQMGAERDADALRADIARAYDEADEDEGRIVSNPIRRVLGIPLR